MGSKRTHAPPEIVQIVSVKEHTPCFKMGKSQSSIAKKDSIDFTETESPYFFFPIFLKGKLRRISLDVIVSFFHLRKIQNLRGRKATHILDVTCVYKTHKYSSLLPSLSSDLGNGETPPRYRTFVFFITQLLGEFC